MPRIFSGSAAAAALMLLLATASPAAAIELSSPVDCAIGEDCFVQQFVDTDPGPDAQDPFCGPASYDDHDGTDFRVRSMQDVARGVAVLSMADGEVLRVRDGEPDMLIETEADRAAVADRECGNGLIVELAEGHEAQYCHLKEGSVAVRPGDQVTRGQKLGEIGASGLAQFPHVHVTLRKDGKTVDPMTGHVEGEACRGEPSERFPLFDAQTVAAIGTGEAEILSFGLSGSPISHGALSREGPPPTAETGDEATVGWAWLINMRGGDRVGIRIVGPDGTVHTDYLDEPVDRSKASYSAFAGTRGGPSPGSYEVTVSLVRDGETVAEKTGQFVVE